jgi:hypothetical protein
MPGRIEVPMNSGIEIARRGGRIVFDMSSPKLDEWPLGVAQIDIGPEDPHGPCMLAVNMRPDIYFAAHYHKSDQIAVVLEGAFRVGRTWYGPGSIRVQEEGAVYGPVQSGPEGCKIVGFFADRSDVADHHASERDRLKAEKLKEKYFGGRRGSTGV